MKWEATINPRVLIVEDEPRTLELLRDLLIEIPDKTRRSLCLKQFDIDTARTVAEAERCIAKNNGNPYDLLLQDLGIPNRKIDDPDRPENGQKLLEKAQREGASKEIIIISAWTDIAGFVAPAFRSGVVDFVCKPFLPRTILPRVIECWRRILLKQSNSLLGEQRISDLVRYAEQALAHRFNECFAGLLSEIADTSEDLEKFARERYGLDRKRDSADPFFNHLNSFRDSTEKSKVKWRELQASLVSDAEFAGREILEDILKGIHQALLPCLIVKNVTLDCTVESNVEVVTFGGAVKSILQELIRGVVATLPDYNGPTSVLEIKVKKEPGYVKVVFKDTLRPISAAHAKEINKGTLSSGLPLWFQSQSVDRVWGLSVMQHLAIRGAGRLEIKPLASGNIITYFIPAA